MQLRVTILLGLYTVLYCTISIGCSSSQLTQYDPDIGKIIFKVILGDWDVVLRLTAAELPEREKNKMI
jgi:hypothetical protein